MKTFLFVLLTLSYSVLSQPLKMEFPQLRMENFTARLDSIIGTGYRYYYSYDDYGNVISQNYYILNTSSGQWTGESKQEYHYNGNQKTEQISYRWDNSTSQWQPDVKNAYIYNSGHKQIQNFSSIWNSSSGSWNEDQIIYSFYDKNNLPIRDSILYINPQDKKWVIYMKITYSYNDSGQVLERAVFNWNNLWRKQSEEKYTYDVKGNKTSKTGYSLEMATGTVSSGSREQYVYDDSNHNIQYIITILNLNTNTFENNSKEAYAYDKQGNKIQTIVYNRSSGSPELGLYAKTENTADAYGNTTETIGYFWNAETQNWLPGFRHDYAYDLSLLKDLINPASAFQDFNFPLHNALTLSNFYNLKNGDWEKLSTSSYYYSKNLITNLSKISSSHSAFSLHPNPSNGDFIIQDINSNGTYTIMTLQGQPISKGSLQKGANTIKSDVPNGTYLFEHNGKTTKFIVH